MKQFIKRLRHSEKGFTLIELLVVIAVLGALAAVAIPNVGRFIGSGTVEAANTEAAIVQTAVMAYMADNHVSDCTGSVGPADDIGPTPTGTTTVTTYLTGDLEAVYTIVNGEITGADAVEGSQWGDLVYDPDTGWGEPVPGP